MDFIFVGLSLSCAGFLVKIVLDYLHEVPIWREKIDMADVEISQCMSKTQELTVEKQNATAQSKTIDDEIIKMEAMVTELKVEIEKIKKEMARTGKIIMRRQTDQQQG